MQALSLNRILHEVCLRDNRRDGQSDRNSHAAERAGILRKVLVNAAHVAGVEVRVGPHGREVECVDAWLGEHEDADAGRLAPDEVQVLPGRVAGSAWRQERGEQVPHVVDAGRDSAVLEPGVETVRLRSHIGDCFGAGEEEAAAYVRGDIAEQLATEAGDFGVVEGAEASKEHRPEGKVGNDLVDNAGDEEAPRLSGAHELHCRAGIRG